MRIAPPQLEQAEGGSLLGPSGSRIAAMLDALLAQELEAELRGRALFRRAELRMFEGELSGAVDDLAEAGPLLPEGSVHQHRARMLGVRLLTRTLHRDEAHEMLDSSQRAARRAGPVARLAAHLAAADLALDEARGDDAALAYGRALGLASGPSTAHERFHVQRALATLALLGDQRHEAVPWLSAAAELAAEHEDEVRRVQVALDLGTLLAGLDQVDEALGALSSVADSPHIDASRRPLTLSLMARAELHRGQLDRALRYALDCAKAAAAVGNAAAYADGAVLAANAQMRLGRSAEALETLHAAEQILRRRRQGPAVAIIQMARSELSSGSTGPE